MQRTQETIPTQTHADMIRYLCFYQILLACLRNIRIMCEYVPIYTLSNRKVNVAKHKKRQQLCKGHSCLVGQ
jgi:hypothetical protein